MIRTALTAAVLALTSAIIQPARAQDLQEFNSAGLPGSQGIVVRMQHPASWKKVATDDELALAELQGPQGRLTGILQVARGPRQAGAAALCPPERAPSMLQHPAEPDARVTEVFARTIEGRPGYEIRYERNTAPALLLVRSVIVCLKDSRVLVSCGATGPAKAALSAIEPVCRRVLDSLRISED
jgi:hypothetical protein